MVEITLVQLRCEHEDAQAHSELGRGETGTVFIGERLAQIRDQILQFRIEVDYGLGRLPQYRIAN
ncbi:hypothetical protein GCM10010435_83440 [Winogradskya consettensis]|uniref:Uncharacterized protein n=1 Tax=Winogradskya consettensis TaxID=113560 RepID=A0A919SZJ7_9ACTN|nr:hypothetical protein Aco04nite_80660 [Actinoplanes consettensis]